MSQRSPGRPRFAWGSCWLRLGRLRVGRRDLGRRGIAAVEFAIAGAFLSLALVATYDFGRASWTRMQVVAAAHIGAAFAASNGFNSSLISGAVTSSSNLATLTASPAPAQVCGCPAGTAGVTIVTCGSTCTAGNGAGTYVQVSARGTYSFVFRYPLITSPVVITATALARIQ